MNKSVAKYRSTKRKINIFCTFILITVFLSVFSPLWGSFEFMKTHLKFSIRCGIENTKSNYKPVWFNIHPTGEQFYNDSLYNTVTKEQLPVLYTRAVIGIPPQETGALMTVSKFLDFIGAIALLIFLINFIRIIKAINKDIIFAWSNVSKLRIMGYSLLINFCVWMLSEYLITRIYDKLLDFPGFLVTHVSSLNIKNLVIGVIALLVAEIFALGLRLQEDQELTI